MKKEEKIADLAIEFDKIAKVLDLTEHFKDSDVVITVKHENGDIIDEFKVCEIEDLKRYYINVIGIYKKEMNDRIFDRIYDFIVEVYSPSFQNQIIANDFISIIANSIEDDVLNFDYF